MFHLHAKERHPQESDPQKHRSPRRRPRLQHTAAATLLTAVAIFATSASASAHDTLINSTPAPGERFDVAPSEVSLTFSDDVLTLGAAIIVADESGRDWALPDPVIADDTVSASLASGMAAAGYELRWRVVSADGHPISGVIPFTIGDGEPFVGAPSDGASEPNTQESSAPETNTAVPLGPGSELGPDAGIQTVTRNNDAGGILRSVALGVGGAVLALGIAMLVQFIRRRTPRPDVGALESAPTQHIDPDDTSGSHQL